MKKIWAMKKETEAVSPVIATILMVAITVVLAAVLYVMVLGIGGGGQNAPPVALSSSVSGDGTKWIVSVISVQGTAALSDLYVKITRTDGTQAMYKQLSTFTSGEAYQNVTYYDSVNANSLDAGDYFTLLKSAFAAGTKVELIHINGLSGQVTL